MATCSGNLEAMRAANPNFDSQMRIWQGERSARGENPLDWEAFRLHETRIFAPDPGPNPPQVFCDYKKSGNGGGNGGGNGDNGEDFFEQIKSFVSENPLLVGGALLLILLMRRR